MPPRFQARNSPSPPPRAGFSPSIGKLYRDIPISSDAVFTKEDLAIPKEHRFILFCRDMYKRFPGFGANAVFAPPFQEAIDFLGWKLKPQEFSAAIKGTAVLAILGGLVLSVILGLLFGGIIGPVLGVDPLISIVYIFIPFILIGALAANWVQTFPIAEAKREQLRALTYVPDMVGYMIMSMKLVPNLEKAVDFASEHGKGRISYELKRISWNTQLGLYNTVAEGLDDLAYKWGKYSTEFKQALMNIRASVLENTEAKRYQLLDKTMDDVLESVQGKMEQYARELSQPSTALFYIGVLLPLILIIILPAGSAFSGSPLAQTWVLALIYNVGLPLLVLWFGFQLLETRPPTYVPPTIPDNFPGLPPKNMVKVNNANMNIWVIVGGILLLGGMVSGYLHFFGLGIGDPEDSNSLYLLAPDNTLEAVLQIDKKPVDWFEAGGTREQQLLGQGFSPDKAAELVSTEKARFFAQAENDITPYNLIFGFFITISFAVAAFVRLTTEAKRKVQEKYMQMESEFKDSLYVLASRLGENKPIEDALRHTQTFLPNNLVSQEVFGKTVDNIHVLGMPLEAAVFDPAYGSLKHNPSRMITTSMKIAIDSVQLGVGVAARTLVSLSRQLGNTERVSKMLTVLIKDITGTMKLVSVYIAPIVLGITTSLQRIVVVTLVSINATSAESAPPSNLAGSVPGFESFGSTDISSFIKPEVIASLATPGDFMIIVALYVIQLVLIMNYFITLIEENNELSARRNAAQSLPIAVILFVLSSILSNILVAGNFA